LKIYPDREWFHLEYSEKVPFIDKAILNNMNNLHTDIKIEKQERCFLQNVF
jgi:hypothetical protein